MNIFKFFIMTFLCLFCVSIKAQFNYSDTNSKIKAQQFKGQLQDNGKQAYHILGDIQFEHQGLKIQADQAHIHFTSNKKNAITAIKAQGNPVVLTHQLKTVQHEAKAKQVYYQMQQDVITLKQNVSYSQNSSSQNVKINSDSIKLTLQNKQIETAKAVGNPVILLAKKEDGSTLKACAAQAFYNVKKQTILLSQTHIIDENRTIDSPNILYHLKTGEIETITSSSMKPYKPCRLD